MFVVILPVRAPVGLVWMLHCVLCLVHSNIYFVILLDMNFCIFIFFELVSSLPL